MPTDAASARAFTPAELDAVIKAYDVRGLAGSEITEELAYRLGNAFVTVLGEPRVVIGHDMRPSSPSLSAAFARGVTSTGLDVNGWSSTAPGTWC